MARRSFLLVRTTDGTERRVELQPERGTITLGRGGGAQIDLEWDEEVSRLHGTLEPIGDEWVYSDDGLSRNGSFVNGARLDRRHRLRDNDELRLGRTRILFRSFEGPARRTAAASSDGSSVNLTHAQLRVLGALCRPAASGGYALPATNQQIADELFLSINTVKSHIRRLAAELGVSDLPKNQQRARLVELALQADLVRPATDTSGA